MNLKKKFYYGIGMVVKNSTQLKISNWNSLYISKYGAYRKAQKCKILKNIFLYTDMNNTFLCYFIGPDPSLL